MKKSAIRNNPIIKGSLIGVVIALGYYLLIIGINSQHDSPVVAEVAIDGLIAITIFGIILYFDKKRDKRMDEFGRILRRLDRKK